MRRFWWWLLDYWQPILFFIVIIAFMTLLLGYKLDSLTPGFSQSEVSYIRSIQSGKQILNDPTFLPHKILTYGLLKLKFRSAGEIRLVSAFIAAIGVVAYYLIVRRWRSTRLALLASLLLLSSSWLLSYGRLAVPVASFLLLLPILWLAIWATTTRKRKLGFGILALASALAIYIPGFIWLFVILAIWQRHFIYAELKKISLWYRLLISTGVLAVISLLVWAGYHNWHILLEIAGLPNNLAELRFMPINIWHLIDSLFWRAGNDPLSHLANLPVLDIFSIVMLALGIYTLRYKWRLNKSKMLFGGLIIFGLLASMGGSVNLLVLLPVIYIFIAEGLAFTLKQWLEVFPRNPFARLVGIAMLVVAIGLTSYYHIDRYFVAWRHNPQTIKTFQSTL